MGLDRSTVDRDRLTRLFQAEQESFTRANPESQRLAREATRSLVGGVPMNWMSRWPGPFPLFGSTAGGSRIVDVDGHEYIDFCLGDTGAMTGHAPPATVKTVGDVAAAGLTTMLPSEDSIAVGDELGRRFGLPVWQFALTATDANRFAIRLARWLTGRPKILVFNWCYHGTVDETFAVLGWRPGRHPTGQHGTAGRSGCHHPGRRVQRSGRPQRRPRPR